MVEIFQKLFKIQIRPHSQKEKIQVCFVLNVASLFLPTLLILLLVNKKKRRKKESKCERQHGKKKSGKKCFK